MVMKTIEDRIVRIEKRILRKISSLLIIGFGVVFLIFNQFVKVIIAGMLFVSCCICQYSYYHRFVHKPIPVPFQGAVRRANGI